MIVEGGENDHGSENDDDDEDDDDDDGGGGGGDGDDAGDVGLCGALRTGVWPAQKGLIMPLLCPICA